MTYLDLGRRARMRLASCGMAALFAFMAVGAAEAQAFSGKVDDYEAGKRVLVVKKKGGKLVKLRTVKAAKLDVDLLKGKRSSDADVNELVAGAKVLGLDRRGGKVTGVDLRERPSGSSDCSFDMSEEPSSEEDSFDCSAGYEDEKQRCSYDQSEDGGEGDRSEDSSWDCSYEYGSLSWDCSFDSSQSTSHDPDGGDSDADFSFDCSWESEQRLDGPLWKCALDVRALGFECSSSQLGQEFGAQIDTAGLAISLDSHLDFSRDYVDDEEGAEKVDCDKSGSALDCSFDGDGEAGDCEFDVSFDRSQEPGYTEGEVSGDGSMSCSYEADEDGGDEEDDEPAEGDDA